jgi:hypothetical protein
MVPFSQRSASDQVALNAAYAVMEGRERAAEQQSQALQQPQPKPKHDETTQQHSK